MNVDARQGALKPLLEALAELKDLQPGSITRRVLEALAKMLTPEAGADPGIEELLKRIGLSRRLIESQREARTTLCSGDQFEAGFISVASTLELDALEQLAVLATFSRLTPEETARTLEGDFKGAARRVAAHMLEQQTSRASELARKGAAARHAEHNKKAEEMRAIWRTGKYRMKKDCARSECRRIGMSYEAALKALRAPKI